MKAGSLEIEIFANLARLQKDMNAMKSAVGSGLAGVDEGFNRARSSSERYLASLEAEAAKIGKTSAAIKQMEIEANAVAASAAGFDDLAQKIRSTGAAMEQAKLDAAALATEKDRLAAETRDAAAAEAKHANDLASLRASIDPLGAAQARVNEQMQIAATAYQRGEMEAEEYARTTKVLETRLEEMKVAQDRANGGMIGTGKTAVLTKSQMLNLGYQVQDLSVQMLAAAQSSAPLKMGFMALIQQGAQIQGIGAQAGIGLGGMAKAAAGMIATVSKAVLLNPIFLGIATAVGIAYGAFKYFQGEVKKSGELDRYAKSLGMTKEEIAKAGGAAVTFGDVLKGTWKTISDGLGLDKVFKGIGDWASSAFEKVLSAAKTAVTWIYGGFVGSYRAILATWKMFPAVLGELFINGTNAAIEAINRLIKAAIDGVNWMARQANEFLGGNVFGQIGDFAIETMENKFAGAGAKVGGVFVDEIAKGVKEGEAGLNRAGASLWKNIVGAGEARLKAGQDADKSKPKVDKHAEALLREAAAANAAIKGLYALADAHLISDAAALKAEATAKAVEKAIKKRGEQELFVAQELRRVVAERTEQTAKSAADAKFQAEAQQLVNDQVRKGTLLAERAGDALAALTAQRSILAAIQLAEDQKDADGKKAATKALNALIDAQMRDLKTKNDAAAIAQTASNNNEIEMLELELKLINATNRERAVAIATLKAEQELKAKPGVQDPAAFIRSYVDLALAQENLSDATDAANAKLSEQADLFAHIDQLAQDTAETLSSAFGNVGSAFGDMLTNLTGYAAKQVETERHLAEIKKQYGEQSATFAREQAKADQARGADQIALYGRLFGSAKSFFKEGTSGYKAMAAAEKAFALVQLANTAINVAAGAAKMFGMMGPLGFPAVAAMVAVMAGLGFAAASGGGGNFKPPTAEELQAQQGTGSVLGDGEAKSASIANSLALMLKNTNKDLEYSNQMVRSLRAIETNIGALSSLLASQLGVKGGAFSTDNLGLGSKTSLGLLGGWTNIIKDVPIIGGLINGIAKALFGTKKTTTLLDQGIQFAVQSVEDIINGGALGSIYQDVQTQTKKKFLGITTSNKTKVTTSYGDLDNDMERQVSLIIGSMRAGILDAAGVLGVDGAQAALDAFTVNIGKISLKDLTGTEIQEQLEAVFSKLGDDMAKAALPGLEAFQRVGEGVFETLARLAKDYVTIDTSLRSIGMTFGSVGMASLEAREALIDLFGGLDEFTDQTNFFRENFLTEAEQMAPIISAVRDEMSRLGAAGVTTNDQFKALVLGQDLTTESGREMYASLLAVAPAFDKVNDYLATLNGELGETGKTAAELAAIAKQSRSLDIQLMEATGNAAGALAAKRADELAALDESLRAKQQEVWSAQDAAEAARVLSKANEDAANLARALAEKRSGLEIRIMELEGNAAGALAAQRSIELAALDESLRPLQERIYALTDERAAQEAANEALRDAQELANSRRALEIQIMELSGNAAGALAAQRALELNALDPSLRALQERVYALQDERTAQEALTEAQRVAAGIASERRNLEIRLMEATGNSNGALNARRADELSALDASNHALLQNIFAAEDARAAQEALADAQSQAARAAEAAANLNIRLLEAQGNSDAALAARRQLELASATDQATRATLQAIYAAEDLSKVQAQQAANARQAQEAAARAAQQAAEEQARAQREAAEEAARLAEEIANKRNSLEIELMRAIGDETGALARQRQLEIAALDPSLRALQRQVWAEQDAAAAREVLAKQQEEAAAEAERAAQAVADLAKARRSLEIQLMEALGDASGALIAKRADEIAALDPTLRAIQNQIWAAQDAAAAAQALADAQAEAARVAEEAAAKAAEIEDKRATLTIALLQAQGNAEAALAMTRDRERAAIDPLLRALQDQVWATQDAADAANALAEAQAEAAAKAEQLRQDRIGLEVQLLELQGATAAATALKRQEELAAMDATLRPLQMLIYAYQDAAAAQAAHAEALAAASDLVASARDTLTASYQREADALRATIDQFRGFSETLRDFRDGLYATDAGSVNAYRDAQVKFIMTSALAATRDVAAIGSLADVGKTFLDASRNNASSLIQYQRDVAMVARGVDAAIGASDGAVDTAVAQLAALDASVAHLIDINESVISVHDAIVALEAALAAEAGLSATSLPANTPGLSSPPEQDADEAQALRDEIAGLHADNERMQLAVLPAINKFLNILDRWDGDGMPVRNNDAGEKLDVEVTA